MSFGAEARARLAVLPVCALVVPWRCSLGPPLADRGEPAASSSVIEKRELPAASAATAKREAPAERVSIAPPRPPSVRVVTLPEEVVLKTMAAGQPLFLRCWTKAQRVDPGLDASKVRLRLEIDAAGKVTAVQSDTDSPPLARCLAVAARQLAFPAPGRPIVVELPLMFR